MLEVWESFILGVCVYIFCFTTEVEEDEAAAEQDVEIEVGHCERRILVLGYILYVARARFLSLAQRI
jgi:hypothetical protein